MAMNGNINPRQRAAIAALMSSPTVKAAAEKVNVGSRTLYRWMANPEFQAALQAAEDETMAEAARLLLAGHTQALATLAALMKNARNEQVRRQSAKDWLDLWLRVHELRSLEKRLIELEIRLNVNQE